MKKITAIFVATLMLLLAACSAPAASTQPETPAAPTSEMPAQTEMPDEEDASADEEVAPEDDTAQDSSDDTAQNADQDTSDDPLKDVPKFGDFYEFETTTVAGDTITHDLFKDYKLTMVNVWETWCPPCVAEMPYLQKVYEGLPEGANLITVSGDAISEPELAEDILTQAGATFDTIVMDYNVYQSLYPRLIAFPTTFFVDSEGNIVGDPITGLPQGGSGDITEQYLAEINERLEALV